MYSNFRNRRETAGNTFSTPARKLGFERAITYDDISQENNLREISTKIYDNKEDSYQKEEGILEEMEISPDHIFQRIMFTLGMGDISRREIIVSIDFATPILIFFTFLLTLKAIDKLNLAYINTVLILGILFVYFIVNVSQSKTQVSLYITTCVLGYSFLPITLLAWIDTLFDLKSFLGTVLCLAACAFSAVSSMRYFSILLRITDKNLIILYPSVLFYLVFILILI